MGTLERRKKRHDNKGKEDEDEEECMEGGFA